MSLQCAAALLLVAALAMATAPARQITSGPFAGSYANEITYLPGWSHALPSRMWSGYVAFQNASTHTFFVFAESQRDPKTDPLAMWFTGGPGCSGLLGMMYENGPFSVAANGRDLVANPFAYNTIANMVWLEQPASVGFSYNNNGTYVSGDNIAAQANVDFVGGFIELFSEFQPNPFFLTGESYAGMYVSQLAMLIARNIGAGVLNVNFQGWAVGNPSTDFAIEAQSYFPFMAGMNLLSQDVFDNANATCNGNFAEPSERCQQLLANITTTDLYYINPYSVFSLCLGDGPSPSQGCFTSGLSSDPQRVQSQTFVPCLDLSSVEAYLNEPEVQRALHVAPQSPTVWTVCSAALNYDQYAGTAVPNYQALAGTAVGGNVLRVLVYSGTGDSCVPVLGTELAVASFGFGVVHDWHAWNYVLNNATQTAGHAIVYDRSTTFATILGAGHMVPFYAPQVALIMMERFFDNLPF